MRPEIAPGCARGLLHDIAQLACQSNHDCQGAISGRMPKAWFWTSLRERAHTHVPSGAIPKDGPCAVSRWRSTLASAYEGKAVRSDTAGNGASQWRQRKSVAAHRAGIERIRFCRRPMKRISRMSRRVRDELTFMLLAERIEEVPACGL